MQEAKQRFSELIRAVADDGPQTVTRQGVPVAVVVGFSEFRRLTNSDGFKEFLQSAPDLDELDIRREAVGSRRIELE